MKKFLNKMIFKKFMRRSLNQLVKMTKKTNEKYFKIIYKVIN